MVIISAEIKKLLDDLVRQNDREFTLFGKTREENGDIYLEDVRVPTQRSTYGSTEVDKEHMLTFVEELINEGEDPARWNMWIHSHNKMGAFWSNIDKEQMASFNMGDTQYFSHLVLSEKKWRAAITMYKPFPIFADDIEIKYEGVEANPKVIKLEEKILLAKKKVEDLEDKRIAFQKEPSPRAKELAEQLKIKNPVPVYATKDPTKMPRETWNAEAKKWEKQPHKQIINELNRVTAIERELDKYYERIIKEGEGCPFWVEDRAFALQAELDDAPPELNYVPSEYPKPL